MNGARLLHCNFKRCLYFDLAFLPLTRGSTASKYIDFAIAVDLYGYGKGKADFDPAVRTVRPANQKRSKLYSLQTRAVGALYKIRLRAL